METNDGVQDTDIDTLETQMVTANSNITSLQTTQASQQTEIDQNTSDLNNFDLTTAPTEEYTSLMWNNSLSKYVPIKKFMAIVSSSNIWIN